MNVRRALGALLVPVLAVGYASYAWWEQAEGAYREDTTQYMMVLIVPVLVLAGIVILQSLFEALRAGGGGAAPGDGPPGDAGGAGAADTAPPSKDGRGRYLRPALLTAGALALVLTIDRLGYLPAFALFAAGALLAMGVRSAWRIAAITAGVLAVVHVVFIEILDQPLPRGLLEGMFDRGAGG